MGKLSSIFITVLLFTLTSVGAEIIPGEFLIKAGPSFEKNYKGLNAKRLSPGRNVWLVKNVNRLSLEKNADIQHIEPNQLYKIEGHFRKAKPTDPNFVEQWGLHNSSRRKIHIDALRAWEITEGNKNIKIAVIDTGIDIHHEDLKENLWTNLKELNGKKGVDDDGNGYIDDIHGYNALAKSGDMRDDYGHGTHCAGIIGAVKNNGLGVVGIMPKVSLVGVKFMDHKGRGTLADAIAAINYATDIKVDVMSNSWGGGDPSDLLEEAIANAGKQGILFIVAAGNSANDNDGYAVYPNNYAEKYKHVISVAAHNSESNIADFSNYGKKTVNVAAPGVGILSTFPRSDYAFFDGTSMAAPFVAGMTGLLLAKEPKVNIDTIKERLIKSSVANRKLKNVTAKGRVNAYYFLKNRAPIKPSPNNWKTYKLKEPIQSAHPYRHGVYKENFVTVPGAKYVRAVIKKFDLDKNFDFVKIRIPSRSVHREVVEEITGQGENYITEYIEGDSMDINFDSRYVSDGNWGFIVEELQYID